MAVFIDFMAVFKDMFTVLCLRLFIVSYDLEYEFLLIFFFIWREESKKFSIIDEVYSRMFRSDLFVFSLISSNCDLETSKLAHRSQ